MSVIATALKHMMAAGMRAEDIVAAVEEMERSLSRDPVAEKRRAYDRERKRRQRANSAGGHGTVTGQSQEAPLSRPPNENNSNPPTHTPPEKTPARKGTRLAEDWEPSELKGQAAEMVKRWPPGAIERELAKFRNYWPAKPGKDGIKSDWQKTWVNWLISADERIPKNGASKTPDGRSMGRTEAAARNVLTRLGIDPDGGGESPPSPGIASDYRGRTVALPNPMRPQRFNAG